jgi:ubiquitin-protein ligase E3 A
MADLASKIVKSYFHQFTSGCDRIVCDCEDCKSSPSFRHILPTPASAACLAISFCWTHQFERVCPGLSPLIENPKWIDDCAAFDAAALRLIAATTAEECSQWTPRLFKVLPNPGPFPFVLGGTDIRLEGPALGLNDDLLASLAAACQAHATAFSGVCLAIWEEIAEWLISEAAVDRRSFVRGLILVWVFDPQVGHSGLSPMVSRVMWRILDMPSTSASVFFGALQLLPRYLRHIVAVVVKYVEAQVNQAEPGDRTLVGCAQLLWQLRERASEKSWYPLPSSAFWSEGFCRLLDAEEAAFSDVCHLRQFPAILTLAFKNKSLRAQLEQRQNVQMQRAFHEQRQAPRFIGDHDSLIRGLSFDLTIRRDHILEDTMQAIGRAPADHLGRRLMVTFTGEEAVDAGGVSREYFHLLVSQLFSPDYGMFKVVSGRCYWFNASSLDDPIVYRTLGTVVALGVYNEIILPIRFPLLLYRKILRRPIMLRDVAEIEPELVRGWTALRDMRDSGQEIRDVMLHFTVTVDNFGAPKVVEIIEGGENIEVTSENLDLFIEKCMDWYANTSISRQFEAFEQGFGTLFGTDRLALFAPDELDILVSGEEVLDWEALERNAKYSDGYRVNSKPIRWFWAIFRAMSNKEKAKFLQFTTGSDRAPIGGLSKVGITIQKVADRTKLPMSHTCFSTFGLPCYATKEEMKTKLDLALNETEGFGLR